MSEIICQWLNEELGLSKRVEIKCFAKDFATGYLIGEVLHKYQLQDDFDQFSQNRVANSKLNNFTRVEPTLHLLGIPFDQNVAQNIMSEQQGAATRLLYQMYIALQKKKKAGLTGVAMETMRAAAPAKLQSIGTEMYRERLKSIVPRQSDISLQKVSEQFDLKAKEMDEKLAQIQNDELKKIQKIQEELRLQDIEKLRRARRRQNEIMARIQAAIVQIPKPPQNRTLKAMETQKMLKRKKEAEDVFTEISKFEKSVKKDGVTNITVNNRNPTLQRLRSTVSIGTALLKLDTSDDYIKKIQKRLEEDTIARDQREKRRRRILMEQLVAHGAQEEAFREEQLINRLMRQSQQERRIAVQLMHARHEKEVLRQNRLFREKQYEERREREFQEALDREAALQKQAKLECEEQIRKVKELHDRIAAERADARYKKHYMMCQEIMNQIVDVVTKTGEYRELTNRMIPVKLMREWKELFFCGYPLYEEALIDPLSSEPSPAQLIELEKEGLLDEKDYEDYKAMTGDWKPSEAISVKAPALNNNILGYVVRRLLGMVYPPMVPTPPPAFPPFSVKGCVLGKHLSGKSTCLKHLAQAYSTQVLCVDNLLQEALQAYYDGEIQKDTSVSGTEQGESDKVKEHTVSHPQIPNGLDESSAESISQTKQSDLAETEMSQQQTIKPAVGEEDPEPKRHIATVPDIKVFLQGVALVFPAFKAPTPPWDLNLVFGVLRPPFEPLANILLRQLTRKMAFLLAISARAQLGANVEKHLKKGKGVPDDLLIEILVEAINRIPANTGWIVDGFPTTITQAKLLEKALTGSDPEKTTAKSKKNKSSSLVKDPTSPKDPPLPPPALDFAVLIDVSDEVVLQRFAAKNGDPSSNEAPKAEDQDQARDQIQHRITGFLDRWPKLESWFSEQQSILIKVNGDVEEDVLYKKMEEVFLRAIVNKQNKAKEIHKIEEIPPPPLQVTPPPTPPVISKELHPPSSPKQTSAKKGRGSKSPKGSRKRSDTSKEKKEKKTDTPRGKDLQRSPKSGTPRGRSPGKKTRSAHASPEPATVTPVGPPPIQPGSSEWVYVNEPLPQEFPEFLVPYWETIENTYGITIKAVLRSIRQERLIVIHYLYDIRNKFQMYLKRPDHKQEFVSQWQTDFNSTAEDLLEDEDTKAELHRRVDELSDRLWDICDNRKEEAEQERNDIMNDGWLQDHIGILVNHFFSLMQAEVDRFQDTLRLLRDYYQGMEGRMPSDTSQEFARIPLLDIVNTNLQGEAEKPKRIPLVPRRAQSPEQNTGKHKSKTSLVKGKEDPPVESSGHISETDEKLIADTWQTALTAIANMVSLEKQTKETEEEKERQMMEIKEKERLKAPGGSGKGGKKISPNRKKGGKSPGPAAPTTPLPNPEDSTELNKKQELKMKMRQEYFAAVEHEEMTTNSRLELIKSKALDLCQDLASRAADTYKDLETWLGARFVAEMSCIDKLIQLARHHIEISTKIQYELVLENADFYISSDVKVIPDPIPPPRPLPIEISANATLTISQLRRLHQQFSQIAPEGLIANKSFINILMNLTSMNLGNDALPDLWMHLTRSEIQEITLALSLNSDVVNWRKFLLSASLPWPYPSVLELLKTLDRFKEIDHNGCGTVTQENYNQVELWFSGKVEERPPENPTEPLPFNRLEHLIKYFFDMFVDERKNPPQLDYTEMLLYFASHPDPMEGFYRALSVTTGKPVLKRPEENFLLKSLPVIDPLQQNKAAMTECKEQLSQNSDEITVTLKEILRVFQHGASKDGDNHRFSQQKKEENYYNKDVHGILYKFKPIQSGRELESKIRSGDIHMGLGTFQRSQLVIQKEKVKWRDTERSPDMVNGNDRATDSKKGTVTMKVTPGYFSDLAHLQKQLVSAPESVRADAVKEKLEQEITTSTTGLEGTSSGDC
ncbi:sperm flagellar protein 2 [Rhinophrynus dorsalis]